MILDEVLKLLLQPDRLRIIKDGKVIFIGYLARFNEKSEETGLTGQEEVEKLRAVPELRSKYWKEKGLMPPCEPEQLAQYTFSDLEMKLYYDIHLK